jgi:carbonic anhydrase
VAESVEELLERNRRWAERIEAADPGFFARLGAQQKPRFLWIGCSDSRLPATQITDLLPGEMFVHRNVANVVSPADANLLAVVEFAVDVLGVSDLVVCGHYGCGGVEAVIDRRRRGRGGAWLEPVAALAERHGGELARLPDRKRRIDRLCELIVAAQVEALSRTEIVAAWRSGRRLAVHGFIYRVGDGRLRDLGVARSGEAPS